LVLWAGPAAAHDTWFEWRGTHSAGITIMALGTGNEYPVYQYPIRAEHLQRRGCRSAGRAMDLTPVGAGSTSLIFKVQLGEQVPASCWAQLLPAEIELKADVVPIYLEEARPPPSVRETWAAIQARGLPWRERYTKHARIVFSADAASGTAAPQTAGPQDLGMDMVLLGNGGVLHEGDRADVQVLRDGLPLAGLAVELRPHAEPALGNPRLWMQTDAEGRVRLQLPLAGKWLLRGIDIRPSVVVPDTWDSRFATLVFDVSPRAAR
jgi:hypothetical protein